MPPLITANPMSFRNLSLEDGILRVLELGYDQIEVWRQAVEPFETPQLREQLKRFVSDQGSRIVGFNAADMPYFQSLQNREDIEVGARGLNEDIDIAHELGADYVCTFEGRPPINASREQNHGSILQMTTELFSRTCEHAQSKNLSVWVEVHPFTLGIDLDWLCKLFDAVDSPNFGVVYDPCHFGVGLPDDYLNAITLLGERIHCVHFSDSDKVSSELHFPPGDGCLDLWGIFDRLKAIGYRGAWMVDHWLYPMPEVAAKKGLAYLRQALQSF